MSEDRLITVAIHTYEKAVMLKTLLENEGVPVVLHNVNLVQPVISSGVRVRIKEKDLPLALRIIENTDIFTHGENNTSTHQKIIVPVDFSDYSLQATSIAFHIAYANKTSIILLHSFIDPFLSGKIQLTNSLSYELDMNESRKKLEAETEKMMSSFVAKIKEKIKNGTIPPVKFSTDIREGVPEDVIIEYAKHAHPMLIVMGTRGAGKKEKELIGSVTAEVLDSCRFPVFSVPEMSSLMGVADIKEILFFSNLDQDDILALDALYRLFPNAKLRITLAHILDKKRNIGNTESMNALLKYCTEHYPEHTFTTETFMPGNIVDEFKTLESQKPHSILVVPNKKKNVFARLFNPSIAHKLLFNADIPMMVIPV